MEWNIGKFLDEWVSEMASDDFEKNFLMECLDEFDVQENLENRMAEFEGQKEKRAKRDEFLSTIDTAKYSDIEKWYEYLDGDVREDTPENELEKFYAKERGRRDIIRLKENLKILGVDVCENTSKDELELLDFLFWLSKDMGFEYKSLFAAPSLENLEYLSERDNSANGKVMGNLIHAVGLKCSWEYVEIVNRTMTSIQEVSQELIWMTELYMRKFSRKKEILQKVAEVTGTTVERMKKYPEFYKADREDTIFEKLYLSLILHELEGHAKDMKAVYGELQKFNVEQVQKGHLAECASFAFELVDVSEIKEYARENKIRICEVIAIDSKKYDKVVDTLLDKYIELFDKETREITGLHVLAMIEDAGVILPSERNCDSSAANKFYGSKTADRQKTLSAALKGSSKVRNRIQSVLVQRINYLYYLHLESIESYNLAIKIYINIYGHNEEISKCTYVCRVKDMLKMLTSEYEQACEFLQRALEK